ncbi:MAG: glutamate racemase [Actinomycetota bacterium]|nr:glutamate racemase [Actinomycetota bacterium]
MVVDIRSNPIGMFDSGVGGLTVARAVIDLLPHEDLIYFGDTARCPYGPRPQEEVKGFALQIVELLARENVKLLVVACNAASSTALDEARARFDLPIVGVIEPGVKAAVAATRNRRIGLIGTEVTVASGAYDRAVARTKANVTLVPKACPRFVEFVEAGDTTSDELVEVAEGYLRPLKEQDVDTVLLACTHYPLLTGVIQYVMGDEVLLISSAEVTANEVFAVLKDRDLLKDSKLPGIHRFIASSAEGISSELGTRFLGPEFRAVEFHPWSERERQQA